MAMGLLQSGCSVPFARALRSRTFTTISSTVTVPSLKKASQMETRLLLGMSEEQLQQLAVDFGQKSFRGKQLYHLLYKRKVKEIQEFNQLPLEFRNDLQEAGWRVGRSPIHKAVTAADGTTKLLIKLEDNRLVETVGIPVKDNDGSFKLDSMCFISGNSLWSWIKHMLSALTIKNLCGFNHYSATMVIHFCANQVGCPLRCLFCATGKGGFSRNLKSHEIVEQVLAIEDVFKQRVTNVVFMGMGEPMLNMKEVLEAHRCLNKDILIGQRMITISTVGVPNTIKKLASYKLQSTLALSLHAPNQSLREKIVPSAKSYPLNAIMKDCRDYFLETRRRVSFEYTLLAGVNDSVKHAIELAELLHEWGRGHHVNLIPFNPIDGSEYKRPSKISVFAFVSALESRKVTASVRQTRGLDASAACGQLRNEFQKSPLLSASINQEFHSEVALAS
ncbi:hypothetical protein R3W88_033361 [Solanum pinnatisectum]|uniref:Radical SAM core domain-containing protein n=1 Tax=Solanum pinnatisectum TaxID=50273 RepID=A0AAV9K1A2_9SOLN|nr:hypothetical protein R3W88_033361 [Solanum pinnatisectum]